MAGFFQETWDWLTKYGLLVVPAAVGFLFVFWLLPKGRRQPVLVASLTGTGILMVTGLCLFQPTADAGPLVEDVLFYIFAGFAVVAGVCMIVQENPVYSALWFAIVILSTCGLFLLQSAPFLAAATIIVYAGAIIVTFLFVIMLAQQTGVAMYDRRARESFLASLAGFILLGALFYTLQLTYASPPPENLAQEQPLQPPMLQVPAAVAEKQSYLSKPSDSGHVAGLGQSLFGDYLYAVELAGTLLLIATIGAIAISARRKEALP